jgi:uncharacterized glyoxalase superfamily protein PhnB
MTKVIGSRSVLAVQDLQKSTQFYLQVLGFKRDGIKAEGWSFLSRDGFHLMLGECPDDRSAFELANHSYFVCLEVDEIDQLYLEVKGKGAEIVGELGDKPWGMREFGIRTIDGHRIMFGQEIG